MAFGLLCDIQCVFGQKVIEQKRMDQMGQILSLKKSLAILDLSIPGSLVICMLVPPKVTDCKLSSH